MRKTAAALLMAALVVPAVGPATRAEAAVTVSCKAVSGSAAVAPALPKLGSSKKVVAKVNTKNLKVAGCSGGGVASASAAFALKFTKPGNCLTIGTGVSNPLKGKLTLTWNTTKTSTIGQVTAAALPKSPTAWKFGGSVTAGPFKGSKFSVTLVYTPVNSGCTKGALKAVTLKQLTPLVIK